MTWKKAGTGFWNRWYTSSFFLLTVVDRDKNNQPSSLDMLLSLSLEDVERLTYALKDAAATVETHDELKMTHLGICLVTRRQEFNCGKPHQHNARTCKPFIATRYYVVSEVWPPFRFFSSSRSRVGQRPGRASQRMAQTDERDRWPAARHRQADVEYHGVQLDETGNVTTCEGGIDVLLRSDCANLMQSLCFDKLPATITAGQVYVARRSMRAIETIQRRIVEAVLVQRCAEVVEGTRTNWNVCDALGMSYDEKHGLSDLGEFLETHSLSTEVCKMLLKAKDIESLDFVACFKRLRVSDLAAAIEEVNGASPKKRREVKNGCANAETFDELFFAHTRKRKADTEPESPSKKKKKESMGVKKEEEEEPWSPLPPSSVRPPVQQLQEAFSFVAQFLQAEANIRSSLPVLGDALQTFTRAALEVKNHIQSRAKPDEEWQWHIDCPTNRQAALLDEAKRIIREGKFQLGPGLVKEDIVPEDDERVLLRGEQRIIAARHIPAYSFLIPYRGAVFLSSELSDMTPSFRFSCSRYAFELIPPRGGKRVVKFDESLVLTAMPPYAANNPAALINDPTKDVNKQPSSTNRVGPNNIYVATVWHRNFPYIFFYPSAKIEEGEELLLEYGKDKYWAILPEQVKEHQQYQLLLRSLQQLGPLRKQVLEGWEQRHPMDLTE
jgi:hypothetical protein